MLQIKENDCAMIDVIACALHRKKIEKKRIETMDLKALYETAQKHSLTAMVYMVLEESGAFDAHNQLFVSQWKDDKDKAIRKNLLFDTERKQILELMEAAGIWYLPLKGIVLKEYYPKYGMRQMSDNDILYDAAYAEKLCAIMKGRGYHVKAFGRGNEDVYLKLPVYNFEMHRVFWRPDMKKYWVEYYDHIKERFLPDEGKRYGFHLSDEDFYVYMTAHAYKHFSRGGTGLRSLADVYVFLQKKQACLDWAYVREELNRLEILDFERMCCSLAKKLFSLDGVYMETMTKEEKEQLSAFLSAGTYGTVAQYTKSALRELQPGQEPITRKVKIRYCLQRIFPGREWCRIHFPFFYRHPYLIPAVWVFRMFRSIFCSRNRIKEEFRTLRKS